MIKYPLNVTIDTNVFEANKFDFCTESSTLNLLKKNVQKGKIKLILSKIVINEIERHISERVEAVCNKAKKNRKEYLEFLPEQYLSSIDLGAFLIKPDKPDTQGKAKDVIDSFLNDCNVERLDAGRINIEEIINDYFSFRPPFENNEKKKSEFPDAFIADEIKLRFGDDEMVAIVSNDNGFKRACGNTKNHLFFSSLGELFDAMNKSEVAYKSAVEVLEINKKRILSNIFDMIDDNRIEVHGMSYDRDGIAEGYDYEEANIDKCNLLDYRIHTIDDIDENIITASLWIHGDISVDCFFDDYDNSIWDSEEKKYVYVDTRHIYEEHSVRFPCRIKIDAKTEELSVLPFKIIMGGDSRKHREEINDDELAFQKDLEDTERESVGLRPLDEYSSYLEENVINSKMAASFVNMFETYNKMSTDYEELANKIDEIMFETDRDSENWDAIHECYDKATQRSDSKLPDNITCGDTIEILGPECKSYTLSIGSLCWTPEADSEETIDVILSSNEGIVASGFIKLAVGFIDFDEEGGVSSGLADDITYEVESVLSALQELIFELNKELENEQIFVNSFTDSLK